jgi:hypothetical protein
MRKTRTGGGATWRAGAALLVVVFLAGIYFSYRDVVLGGAQYDDSYITYRYAANLAEGRGLVFNSYERVNSASSLLFTGILALAYRAGLHDLERVAAALNAAAGAAALVLAFRVGAAVSGSTFIAFLLLLPVMLSGAWTGWAASGMDTVFYAFVVAAFLWAYAGGRRPAALALLAACMLTRPEGILVWISVLAAELLAAPRDAARIGAYAIAGAAVLAALLTFNHLYYSAWIPQPIELKSVLVYYAPGIEKQAKDVAAFFIGSFAALAVPAGVAVARTLYTAVVLRITRRSPPGVEPWKRVPRLDLFLAAFLSLSAVSFVLGPRSDLMRYTIHLLPLLAIAAARLWPELRERVPRAAQVALLASFAALGGVQVAAEARRTATTFHEWAGHQIARQEMGRWLETNVPGRALVLSSDLGAVAYEARSHDFYDVLGLLTRAPLLAAKRDRWEDVIRDLERRRPRWLIDTVAPDGAVKSLGILSRPELSFRSVTRQTARQAPCELTVVRSARAGAYQFVVGRLSWPTPARPSASAPLPLPSPAPRPSR